MMTLHVKHHKFKSPTAPAARGAAFWLTASPRGCLWLFTEAQWAPIREGLLTGNWPGEATPEEQSLLKRHILGNACEVAITPRGNLKIPPHLVESSGIRSKAVWIQKEQCVELWHPPRLGPPA